MIDQCLATGAPRYSLAMRDGAGRSSRAGYPSKSSGAEGATDGEARIRKLWIGNAPKMAGSARTRASERYGKMRNVSATDRPAHHKIELLDKASEWSSRDKHVLDD